MTDKEVMKLAQKLITDFKCESDTMVDFCNTVIKKFEQQPCEDAISRTEAIENFASWYGYDYDNQGYYRLLKQMPPVTPSYNSIKTELKPSEDCISRAKALEMLGDEPENWTDTEKEIQEVNDYKWFKSILENLPSVAKKETVEDCISREEALKVMCDKCPMYNCVTGCSSYRHIEKKPSVQPQPKRGKWNILGCDLYMCSKCYAKFTHEFNYCPTCGADMRGEEV